VQEEKAMISEKALVKVSADLDDEWAKQRPLGRSTSARWRRIPPMPRTPSTLKRCEGRRRLSSIGGGGVGPSLV
jgi:hypothetical protein